VLVSDPLEVVLDRLMAGDHTDPDVQYTVNRFAVLREVEGGTEEPTLCEGSNSSALARRFNAAFATVANVPMSSRSIGMRAAEVLAERANPAK
jgi:hypothetical protein